MLLKRNIDSSVLFTEKKNVRQQKIEEECMITSKNWQLNVEEIRVILQPCADED